MVFRIARRGGRGLAAHRVGQHIVVHRVTRDHAQQRADRPTDREAGRAADDLAPNLHVAALQDQRSDRYHDKQDQCQAPVETLAGERK